MILITVILNPIEIMYYRGYATTVIRYIFFSIVFASCVSDNGKDHPKVMDDILGQYPMFVNVSPDGQKILLKERGEDSFNLFVKDISTATIKKIDDSGFTQLSLTWHPNNKDIFFQELNPKSGFFHLYSTHLDSKKRIELQLMPSSTAIPPLRWSESGSHLAYLATNQSNELFVYDYTKRKVITSFNNMNPYADFQWVGDSTLYLIRDGSYPELSKINLSTNERSDYVLLENGEVNGDFSVKNNKILFIGRKDSEQFFQCYEFDIATRKTTRLTDVDYNVSSVKYSKNGESYFFSLNQEGVNKLYSSDYQINKTIVDLGEKLHGTDIVQEKKGFLLVSNHDFEYPRNLVKIDFSNLVEKVIYTPPKSSILKLSKPDFIRIKNQNLDTEIPAYFWLCDCPIARKTIIFIHGGPHLQVKPLWNLRAALLTKKGFNILVINYRGSSGYSNSYSELGGDFLGQISDIVSGVDFLKEEYKINQEDIILMGSSFGGKLALHTFEELDPIGGLILLSGTIGPQNPMTIKKLKTTNLLAFYGEHDPLTVKAFEFFSKNDLINPKTDNLRVFRNEGHYFHKTSSWAVVYAAIIQNFIDVKKESS